MRYLGYIGLGFALSLVVSIAVGKWLKHVNQAYDREVDRHPDRWRETR